jgi:hypothetical protein
MTDAPAHPPRQAKKPPRRKPLHRRKAKPQAKPTMLLRHGLVPGPKA